MLFNESYFINLSNVSAGSGGLKLNAQSRAALMARLSESAGISAPSKPAIGSATATTSAPSTVVSLAHQVASLPTQGLLGPASPIPTQCLLLKNLFRPEEYVLVLDKAPVCI